MVIPKEVAILKTRPKTKVNVHWISQFSKSSWIETTASGLSYELGVNGQEKVNGNYDIINKNGHSTFHTGKPGNFTQQFKRGNLNYIMDTVTLKLIEVES